MHIFSWFESFIYIIILLKNLKINFNNIYFKFEFYFENIFKYVIFNRGTEGEQIIVFIVHAPPWMIKAEKVPSNVNVNFV